MDEDEKLLKIGKVAKILGVSKKTLRRWGKKGKLSPIRSPGGTRYYLSKDIEEFMNNSPLSQKEPSSPQKKPLKDQQEQQKKPSKAEPSVITIKKPSGGTQYRAETASRKPISKFLKVVFGIFLIFILSFMVMGNIPGLSFPDFVASIFPISPEKITQKDKSTPEEPEGVPPSSIAVMGGRDISEGVLEINAETSIKNLLRVEKSIQAPEILLEKNNYQGTLTSAELTSDRTYTFPDKSGTICLSTGNCAGLRGEVTSLRATSGRLAKFLSPQRIGNSSINDLYTTGISMTIDSEGEIGIGTNTPDSKLDVSGDIASSNLIVRNKLGIGTENLSSELQVEGKIEASGDICTDLSGGKCLSDLSEGPTFIPIGGGGGGGISGSGSSSYVPLWSSSTSLGNSVIFQSGGNIGIGTTSPSYKLDVAGALAVSGSTTLNGVTYSWPAADGSSGQVLTTDGAGSLSWDSVAGGIGGSGTANQIAFFNATDTLSSDSNLYWDIDNSRLGIGNSSPQEVLDVTGTVQMEGFKLPPGAQEDYVLTSDASGVGTWQSLPSGNLPPGQAGETLRYDGTNWVSDSFLYNNGSAIGIGTTSPTAELTVSGDSIFQGEALVQSTVMPQLVLKYDDSNYLNFSIDQTQTEITSSKTMVIDSLTGTIQAGSNVSTLDASGAEVKGDTFISSATDSTVRKSGEQVLRGTGVIFRYPLAAQTNTTTYTRVSKYFENSSQNPLYSSPSVLPGSTERFKLLINYADNIPIGSHSDWRIYRPSAGTTADTFTLSGQNLSSLEEGTPYLTDSLNIPSDDWQVEVKVSNSSHEIRIFNILLLRLDEIQ